MLHFQSHCRDCCQRREPAKFSIPNKIIDYQQWGGGDSGKLQGSGRCKTGKLRAPTLKAFT
jgi:hypothetical protein